MGDPLHSIGQSSQISGISGFVSILKEGILESKIGQLFCKILGIESKTASKINEMTAQSKEALHTARDRAENHSPPQNIDLHAPATHITTKQQFRHESTGEKFLNLQDDVLRFAREVNGTIDKYSSGGKESKLPALRDHQSQATRLRSQLNDLERQAEKEGVKLSPSDLKNLNQMISRGQEKVRGMILEIDEARANSDIKLDHEVNYEKFKPNTEELNQPQEPQGRIDWGSWTGDKFQARFNEFKQTNLAGLTDKEILKVHDVAGDIFNRWVNVMNQNPNCSPETAARIVGANPDQCIELQKLCIERLKGDTAPAA